MSVNNTWTIVEQIKLTIGNKFGACFGFCLHKGTGYRDLYSETVSRGQVPCAYTRGDFLQGQSDLVFDWFIILFGCRD